MFPLKPHVSGRSFLVTTTALVLVSLSLGLFDNKSRDAIHESLSAGSKILFGHTWRYGEYCGDSREIRTKVQDDIELERFYNGTALKSIASRVLDGDSQATDELVYEGLKARTYSNSVCASESWGYVEDQVFARSQSPRNDESECKKSIDNLYESYRILTNKVSGRTRSASTSNENHFEHWRILNTFGRPPSGVLLHQTHVWPGDFAGCTQSVKWRHCYAGVRSANWPSESKQLVIRVGACLPSSCDERMLKRCSDYLDKLDELVKYTSIDGSSHSVGHYRLADLHCSPALDSPHYQALGDPVSKLLAVLALVWIAMIVYANLIKRFVGQSSNKMLESIGQVFDMELNWIQFHQDGSTNRHFKGFNAIKVLAMNWLVCTHVLMLMSGYIVNKQEMRDKWQDSLIISALSQGQHIVSGFFVMSGVLLGYKYFRNGTRPQGVTTKVAVKMIIQRYLRLMPLYLVAYAYAKQFTHLLSRGPFWDAGVSLESEVRQCRSESWLVPLLTLANFVSPWAHCVLTGWHLANDFQIFIALPFLLLAYSRSRLVGRMTTVSIIILTNLQSLWLLHSSEGFSWDRVVAEPLMVGVRHMSDRLMFAYLNPLGRAGTYLLGILIADFVYLSRTNGSPMKAKLVLILGLAQMVIPIFGVVLVPRPFRAMLSQFSKGFPYNILRILGELGWSFVIYYILTKNKLTSLHEHRVRREEDKEVEISSTRHQDKTKHADMFLCWPIWDKLVKLNYCVMLVHFSILRLLIQSQSQLITFSGINLVAYSSAAVAISYVISIFMHLLVEVPLALLVAKLLK